MVDKLNSYVFQTNKRYVLSVRFLELTKVMMLGWKKR